MEPALESTDGARRGPADSVVVFRVELAIAKLDEIGETFRHTPHRRLARAAVFAARAHGPSCAGVPSRAGSIIATAPFARHCGI